MTRFSSRPSRIRHEKRRKGNTLWGILITFLLMLHAFTCGCAIELSSLETLKEVLVVSVIWRGCADLEACAIVEQRMAAMRGDTVGKAKQLRIALILMSNKTESS